MGIHSTYYRDCPLYGSHHRKPVIATKRALMNGFFGGKLGDRVSNGKPVRVVPRHGDSPDSVTARGIRRGPVFAMVLILWCATLFGGCGQEDPDITMPEGVGTLVVTSTPDSAVIQIDGQNTGFVTPATLNDVSAGWHTVRVSREGYIADPESIRIEIIEGQSSEVSFVLSVLQSRPVILESFTNVACTPCADANPMMYELMDRLGPERALLLEFHTQFPSPLDPFYLDQRALMDCRIALYGVSQAPWVVIEGNEGLQPSSEDALQNVIDAVDIRSELELRLTGTAIAPAVTCTLEAESIDSEETYIIHVFITEQFIEFEEPPGSNGETEFRHVVRDVLSSAEGETILLSPGSPETFIWSTDLPWWSGEEAIRLTAMARTQGSLAVVGADLYDLP